MYLRLWCQCIHDVNAYVKSKDPVNRTEEIGYCQQVTIFCSKETDFDLAFAECY